MAQEKLKFKLSESQARKLVDVVTPPLRIYKIDVSVEIEENIPVVVINAPDEDLAKRAANEVEQVAALMRGEK